MEENVLHQHKQQNGQRQMRIGFAVKCGFGIGLKGTDSYIRLLLLRAKFFHGIGFKMKLKATLFFSTFAFELLGVVLKKYVEGS